MLKLKLILTLITIALFQSILINAQDIESIIKSKPFEFRGGFNAGANFYTQSGSEVSRPPFGYHLSGNATVSIYSFDFPFSVSLVDNSFNFSKPNNRFALNPRYKWIQLYFGQNSYNLSPYVFAGQNIKGYGVKLTPGIFNITVAKGSINNFLPQRDTLLFGSIRLPTYERKVLTGQIGINSKVADVEFTFLKGIDETDDPLPNELNSILTPVENFAIGSKISFNILNYVQFGFNGGASLITEDTEIEGFELDPRITRIAKKVITPNISTRIGFAGDGFLRLQVKGFSLGGSYKRIQPKYKTLGLFYLMSDLENITVDSRISLLKGKLSMGGSYGVQRNNLNNLRLETSVRNIASANLFFNHKRLSISGNYSNFSQEQRAGFIEINDTLRVGQVSSNLSTTVSYSTKGDDVTNRISLSAMRFGLSEVTFTADPNNLSTNNNAYLNYSRNYKSSNFGMNAGINFSNSDAANRSTTRYGVTLGAKKTIKKALKISINSTLNKQTSILNTGFIVNNRLSLSYKLSKMQSARFSLYNVIRTSPIGNQSRNISRGSLNYALNF